MSIAESLPFVLAAHLLFLPHLWESVRADMGYLQAGRGGVGGGQQGTVAALGGVSGGDDAIWSVPAGVFASAAGVADDFLGESAGGFCGGVGGSHNVIFLFRLLSLANPKSDLMIYRKLRLRRRGSAAKQIRKIFSNLM